MMNKYRVHEVAKDFKLNSKDIAEIMTKYSQTPKNHMQVLSDKELSIVFEYMTQLGLSEEVIRRLILKTIDPDVLNRLLEHDQFPKLCALMKNYFSNTVANGIMARNQIIDLATDPLAELMSADPSKRTEMIKDLSFLNSSKIQSNEADIEKIKNILMKIIRDVKENMAEEQPSGAVATAEAVKGIRAALPDKPQSELTADDVSTAITAYIGTMITMDENTSELFQQLAKQVLELPLDGEN